MTAALAAAFLAVLLIVPFALLVFGLMCWIDLVFALVASGDTTAFWSADLTLTGICAVGFTAIGGWGCWAVVTTIAGAIA